MPEKLPEYEFPPVNEVVFGLQFQPVKSLRIQHFMEYWSLIRDRYPNIEEQLPLQHLKEKPIEPEEDGPTAAVFQLKTPAPRYWFINPSGNELVQVQKDRFLRNWRQINGNEPYPRFDQLSKLFWQEWDVFSRFVKNNGQIHVDQCELSYINHIDSVVPDDKWDGFGNLPNVFALLQPKAKKTFLPAPEIFSFASRYPLPDVRGRLHVEMTPAFRGRDFKMIVQFTLSARGMSTGESEKEIKAWFDNAHEWIVRGFDELTTQKMHELWNKKP